MLNKNADPDEYEYSGQDIGFYAHPQFQYRVVIRVKMLLFGIENSLSVYLDNRKKDILILGEVPIDGLDDIAITTQCILTIEKKIY